MCKVKICWPIFRNLKYKHPTWIGSDEIEEHRVVHINPRCKYIHFVAATLILHPFLSTFDKHTSGEGEAKTMEAGFLNSNSVTKIVAFVPSNKAAIWDHPKSYARQLKVRRHAAQFSVSCKWFYSIKTVSIRGRFLYNWIAVCMEL